MLPNTSSLEERMAGNAHKRELAFEQAEAALAYVQNNLTTSAAITAIPAPAGVTGNTCGTACATGMYQINLCNPNTANYWIKLAIWIVRVPVSHLSGVLLQRPCL